MKLRKYLLLFLYFVLAILITGYDAFMEPPMEPPSDNETIPSKEKDNEEVFWIMFIGVSALLVAATVQLIKGEFDNPWE